MRYLYLCFILFLETSVLAQQSTPKLWGVRRGIFSSKLTQNGANLSNSTIIQSFEKEQVYRAKNLYNRSKIFVVAAPPIMATGIYLSYDAIKGTPKSVVIDGKEIVYYKRPIFQLIGGIGTFVVGACIMEYGNEFKIRAVDIYNNKLITNEKSKKLNFKAGITPSNNLGLYASF